MPSSPRHRHFVALPLMGLMLATIALSHQFVSATASTVPVRHNTMILADDQEKQFSLPSGTTVLLMPQSTVFSNVDSTLTIQDGSVLVSAAGFASIDVGFEARATVLLGSMLAFRDAQSATIVALTAPVIVTVADHESILPSGYQMRISKDGSLQRTEVPSVWFFEQVARSRSLPVTPISLGDALQTALLAAVEQGNASEAFALIDVQHDAVLSDLTSLTLAITSDRLDGSASDLVVSRIASASFSSAERFFAIPALARTTVRPLPSAVIDLWAQDAIRSAAADVRATATALHNSALPIPSLYDDAGFPLQAELWRAALDRVNDVLSSLLPPSERNGLSSDVSSAQPDFSDPASDGQPFPAHDRAEVKAMTYALLVARGALLGVSTLIEPDVSLSDCARVSGVFLQENNADIPYEFSVCPFSRMIRTIKRARVLLPNDVSFEQFFH